MEYIKKWESYNRGNQNQPVLKDSSSLSRSSATLYGENISTGSSAVTAISEKPAIKKPKIGSFNSALGKNSN